MHYRNAVSRNLEFSGREIKRGRRERERKGRDLERTYLFENVTWMVKPGHGRFNSATRKNHVRKIRARKLYVVKSREREREERLNSFLLDNPVTMVKRRIHPIRCRNFFVEFESSERSVVSLPFIASIFLSRGLKCLLWARQWKCTTVWIFHVQLC